MRSSKIITALVGAGLFGTSVHADLLRNLTIQATEALRAANLTSASGCNLSNAPVRQDWFVVQFSFYQWFLKDLN